MARSTTTIYNEIIAAKNADANQCKHPTENKWAMPVRHYAQEFFNEEDLVEELDSTWIRTLNK